MKRYIKPQACITLVTTSPLLQLGSGGVWNSATQTQEGKENVITEPTNSTSVWGEEE